MDICLKAPHRAKRVQYGAIQFGVNPDGTLDAPSFAVPDLIAAGCEHLGKGRDIDPRQELERCPGHHLSAFLNARDIADHSWDPATHYHSAQLREYAKANNVKTQDGENLFEAAANHLDSLHQTFHKGGPGRVVFLTDDEKRRMALEIYDEETKAQKKITPEISHAP